MDKPSVELSLGRFRFVNGTPKSYRARMAIVPTATAPAPQQQPTNTKAFGQDSTVLGPADEADNDDGNLAAGQMVFIYIQDQASSTWYQGTHANGNTSNSAAVVVYGGAEVPAGDIMIGREQAPTMIDSMSFEQIPASSNGGKPPGFPPTN